MVFQRQSVHSINYYRGGGSQSAGCVNTAVLDSGHTARQRDYSEPDKVWFDSSFAQIDAHAAKIGSNASSQQVTGCLAVSHRWSESTVQRWGSYPVHRRNSVIPGHTLFSQLVIGCRFHFHTQEHCLVLMMILSLQLSTPSTPVNPGEHHNRYFELTNRDLHVFISPPPKFSESPWSVRIVDRPARPFLNST